MSSYGSRLGTREFGHASVAALVKDSLALLSVGAPSNLLEATSQALDTVLHAKLFLGLARTYVGTEHILPVEPSCLPVSGGNVTVDTSLAAPAYCTGFCRENVLPGAWAYVNAGRSSRACQVCTVLGRRHSR